MGTFYTGELPLECSPVFINETAQASRTGVRGQDNTVSADVEGDSGLHSLSGADLYHHGAGLPRLDFPLDCSEKWRCCFPSDLFFLPFPGQRRLGRSPCSMIESYRDHSRLLSVSATLEFCHPALLPWVQLLKVTPLICTSGGVFPLVPPALLSSLAHALAGPSPASWPAKLQEWPSRPTFVGISLALRLSLWRF